MDGFEKPRRRNEYRNYYSGSLGWDQGTGGRTGGVIHGLRKRGTTLLGVGMFLIGLSHFLQSEISYSQFRDGYYRFGSYQFVIIFLSAGWLIWTFGLAFAVRKVTLEEGREGSYKRYKRTLTSGAVMLSCGWLLIWILGRWMDEIFNYLWTGRIIGIYYFLIGAGFAFLGRGVHIAMQEVVAAKRKVTGYMDARLTRLSLYGGIILGIGHIMNGFLYSEYIMTHIRSYRIFGLIFLFQGIGLALLIAGIAFGLRTCLRPWNEWTGESVIDSSMGKASLILLLISAGIFFSVYSIMAYPYLSNDYSIFYDSFYYDFFEYSSLLLAASYFLLAAGIPMAFKAGTSTSPIPLPSSNEPRQFASSSYRSKSSDQSLPSPYSESAHHPGEDRSLILPRSKAAGGWICPHCDARIGGQGRSCTICGYQRSRY